MQIVVNGETHEVSVDPAMPLLWVLRDELGMTGTKFGCGIAMCGACTVHVDGRPMRSCSLPIGAVTGEVTTIEGLSAATNRPGDTAANRETGTPDAMHAVQQAWVENQVAQCGYCQSGQIMSAASLLSRNPEPTDDDIDIAMNGNLCRCGTYPRIRAAIHAAAGKLRGETE